MEKTSRYQLSDLVEEAKKTFLAEFEPYMNENQRIELVNELTDSFVPVMTYDLLKYAENDLWLATVEPQFYAFEGKHTAISAIAGNIYDHINNELLDLEMSQ